MHEQSKIRLSRVERIALKSSLFKAIYPPTEKIKTIIVNNFPALGRLTAMRFIEWVQANPCGVIALPTGKTPEYFIKCVIHFLETWDTHETRRELETGGVDPGKRPDLKTLHFVQIDEFYPMDPSQYNSFYYYVNHYYIDGFGLDPKKALLINCAEIGLDAGDTLASVWQNNDVDLTLRYRREKNRLELKQKKVLEKIDQWCQEYEEKIRSMGGIGFFMGGIGPDGHIGFNVRGSDHFSSTRLTETNYETQAAVAEDLGGIEISRKRKVITIGLGTLTYNPDCTAIIIAAGETKASIVAATIQSERSTLFPATALQVLPNAAFYITKGTSLRLEGRQLALITREKTISNENAEEIIIDLAIKKQKRVIDLVLEDFTGDRRAREIIAKRKESIEKLTRMVHDSLSRKIEKGMHTLSDTRFLHTEPHHDDLMLGCLPYIVRHVRSATNTHYFVTLTSGFTAVTNHYMERILKHLEKFIDSPECKELLEENYFDLENINTRNRDVWQYLDGVAANSNTMKNEGTSRRLLRNLITIYGEQNLNSIKLRITELEDYFKSQYPGKKDRDDIQRLKGMRREWEAECLWGYFGWDCSYILHQRLGFYTGDIFTEEPTLERDVTPIVNVLEEARPDIVTVALDPEASGPDTHYKVLQAITEALKQYEIKTDRKDIKLWGYRNVWCRFHPAEADIFVPVSLNMFSIMQSAFMSTFISQKDASFPTYEYDGPFSELAQKIQVEQYQQIKTCFGRTWFNEHSSPLIRATRGLVFLKELSLEELYHHSRTLRQAIENR